MAQAGDEHTAVVDLANFEKADKGYDVVKPGTSGTGGEMEITTSDISLTSSLGYAKKSEMSIYKNGSLTISLKEGISAHITKVVVTLSNSFPFVEPTGWTTTYTDKDGAAIEASTAAKVADKSVQTFTTEATDITSLTLSNASTGKTGIRKIAITYVEDSQTDNRVATSITLVNPTTKAAVGDIVSLPSAELKAADERA